MKKVLKILLSVFVGFIVLIMISMIIAYFSLSGNYNPKATVIHNKSLSQIKLNEVIFHCETFGDDSNEVVIVLHGGPGLDYKNLLSLKELSDSYFLVFYDQRGSGLSERLPEEKLSFEYYLIDLKAFVNHFGKGRKVNIIGHSWGGILATAFVANYPDKVGKLILAEPGSLSEKMQKKLEKSDGVVKVQPTFSLLLHVLNCWLKSLHIDGPDEYATEDFFVNAFFMHNSEKNHPLASYYCNNKLPEVFKDNWRFGSLASRWEPKSHKQTNNDNFRNWDNKLKKFDNNVLFLVGECDKILGQNFQQEQMKLFNKSKLVTVPNAGHLMIAENPKFTNKTIRNFLNDK